MTDEELIQQLELSKVWISVEQAGRETLPVNRAYLTELINAMLERLKK